MAVKGARSPVFIGSVWMVAISLILFFLPVINGLIAGLVGGYKVGSPGRAFVAALLPALLVAVGLWILLAVLGLPLIGVFTGLAVGGWILLSDVGLLLGAVIGGLMGSTRTTPTL